MIFNPWRRIRAKHYQWKHWRQRKRDRLAYKNEVTHLRRELTVVYQKDQALEQLFILKQEKINRLLVAVRQWAPLHSVNGVENMEEGDMRQEVIIDSFDKTITRLSADFDARMSEYEKTGNLERHERVTTKPPQE